jgi:hypothetical protein
LFIALITILFIKIDITSLLERILEKKYLLVIILIAVISCLILQFKLEGNVHMSLYKNSYLYLGLFESGNILFGALFLLGLRKQIAKHKTNNMFFEYSMILMLIGAVMILASLFFPGGFNNGLIRIINYWTLFAAPIIAPLLLDKKYQKTLIILLSLAAVISLVATSKDPKLFNFELFWDKSDFEAINWICSQNGSYILNNTQKNYNFLSKEETYYKLKDIIEMKEKINCTGQMFLDIKNYSLKNPVYSESGIDIYPIENVSIADAGNITNNKTKPTIIKLRKKGYNCPVIKK